MEPVGPVSRRTLAVVFVVAISAFSALHRFLLEPIGAPWLVVMVVEVPVAFMVGVGLSRFRRRYHEWTRR